MCDVCVSCVCGEADDECVMQVMGVSCVYILCE